LNHPVGQLDELVLVEFHCATMPDKRNIVPADLLSNVAYRVYYVIMSYAEFLRGDW
jgi:hypothetical protein